MPFNMTIAEEAERQFQSLSVRDQRVLQTAIQTRLQDQPTTPTRAIERLRPNPFAEFELRVGDLRVLYTVEGENVVILIVGLKVGNKLLVEGKEFHGHQEHPAEPPESGPGENAE